MPKKIIRVGIRPKSQILVSKFWDSAQWEIFSLPNLENLDLGLGTDILCRDEDALKLHVGRRAGLYEDVKPKKSTTE